MSRTHSTHFVGVIKYQKAPEGALAHKQVQIVGFSIAIPLFEGAHGTSGEGDRLHTTGRRVEQPLGLHVGVLYAAGFAVGVAHIIASQATLSSNLAHSGHKREFQCVRSVAEPRGGVNGRQGPISNNQYPMQIQIINIA